MNPLAHQSEGYTESGASVARIEAQDVHMIIPVREYLERNGSEVVVNTDGRRGFSYVIAVGDSLFVKAFYESSEFPGAKKLAIVYEGDEDELNPLKSKHVKLYLIDPKPLTDKETREIFAFFFTGTEQAVSIRKEMHLPKKVSVIPTELPREHDQKRIAETLQQVFSSKKSPPKKRSIMGIWILIIIAFFMPIILYLSSLGIGAGLIAVAGKSLLNGNTRLSDSLASYSFSYLQAARTLLHVSAPGLSVIGMQDIVTDQDRLLSILFDVSKIETGVSSLFVSTRRIAESILSSTNDADATGIAEVMKVSTDVSHLSQLLALVSADLSSFNMSSRYLEKVLLELAKIREIVGYTEKLLTIYPRIGGFRKKQTFLVLLQNSMELRPTGGFIGSLMLVSFMDGKAETIEVQDVYTADGQLKGHIDPPLAIREILGQEHWYLRDSNWDPDFAVSGKQAAWFYEKEMGVPVDGVIAISLPMVTRILGVTGSIELLDFNERISESNFFAKSLLYTQTDFFPGSTQKKDFLGALATALMTRITTDTSISPAKLLRTITTSLQSKDIQFYFTDPELESLTRQWKWTGDTNILDCQEITQEMECVGDGIGLVAANLGVNKINFFVTEEALTQINFLENGSMTHALTLNIRNSAEEGVYQGYYRILVPLNAQVGALTLDGVSIPERSETSITPPPPPYFFIEDTATYKMVHVPVAIFPKQTRQFTLFFSRPNLVVLDTVKEYQFNIRKQPGVTQIAWHIVVSYPTSWNVTSEGALAKEGTLEYNTTLTKDENIRMVLQKRL